MSDNKINNDYLDLTYKLVRLLDARKKIWIELLDYEVGFKAWNDDKKDAYVGKLKGNIVQLDQIREQTEGRLLEISKQAQECGCVIPFEDLVKEYRLPKEGKYILMALFYSDNLGKYQKITCKDLLFSLGYKPSEFLEKSALLGNLIIDGLIENADKYPSPTASVLEAEYRLTPRTLQRLAGDRPFLLNELTGECGNSINRRKQTLVLMVREPLITFDQIVLDDMKKREIDKAIFQIEQANNLFSKWGFDQTIKYGKGMTMLFSGAPGTGKTATCDAIAHRLGKKVGVANYARILDMWLGNAEKNITKVFDEAKAENCILVFDEADSLFSQRQNDPQRNDRTYNYMTNILMQELERFDGVCILTTNREIVMDTAFNRRILLKLKFDVPAPEERIKIWQTLIPPMAPIDADVDFVEIGSRFVLTGGEIKNVIMNVIRECGYRNEQKITMAALTEYARRETATSVKKATKKFGFLP
jgi:AAA+ superfamily predicted ATPase